MSIFQKKVDALIKKEMSSKKKNDTAKVMNTNIPSIESDKNNGAGNVVNAKKIHSKQTAQSRVNDLIEKEKEKADKKVSDEKMAKKIHTKQTTQSRINELIKKENEKK